MSELTTAARPYARAIFELASDNNQLAQWSDTLGFMGSVVSHEGVRAILDNPRMTRSGKADAFISLCDGKLDDKAENLAKLLSEFGRLNTLPDIAILYSELKNKAEGVVEVTITSTHELSDDEIGRIKQALSTKLGREINVSTQIDESIMGGVIIRAGDMVIDGSIQGRLQQMSRALNG